MKSSGTAILCDFDGTVSVGYIPNMMLEKYTGTGWARLDAEYAEGRIGYREYLERRDSAFSTVNATEEEIWSDLEGNISLRSGFGALVEYCRGRIQLSIVSLGLDFVIRRILQENGWARAVTSFSPAASFNGSGIAIIYPQLTHAGSRNVKDDAVRRCREMNMNVVFIGDGAPDFEASEDVDLRFAVENSTFSRMCRTGGVEVHEFTDFRQVVDRLRLLVL